MLTPDKNTPVPVSFHCVINDVPLYFSKSDLSWENQMLVLTNQDNDKLKIAFGQTDTVIFIQSTKFWAHESRIKADYGSCYVNGLPFNFAPKNIFWENHVLTFRNKQKDECQVSCLNGEFRLILNSPRITLRD